MSSGNSIGLKDSQETETKQPLKRGPQDLLDTAEAIDPNKKTKTEAEIQKPTLTKGFSIKINPPSQKKTEPKPELLQKPSVFDDEEEEEVEEMPAEAKMRMKNIGRDTQTSSGPNSFGKTRQGFCDTKKAFERQLQKAINESEDS